MCGAAVGNYGAAVGNQAQLVGKCGPLPRAGWTETERKRPTVRGLKEISVFAGTHMHEYTTVNDRLSAHARHNAHPLKIENYR